MSDELDWELSDMFDSGLFAFPVYEQNAARRVVRYLLKRGVPDEEISSAIQGSTIDLHAWLNRRGKPMFGEWAMAWMNETRDLHQTVTKRRPIVYRNGSLNDSDSSFSRGSSSASSSSSSSPSDDSDDGGTDYFRSRPEVEDDGLSSFSAFTGSTLDFHSGSGSGTPRKPDVTGSDSFTSVRSCKDTKDKRTLAVSRSEVSRSMVSGSGLSRSGAAVEGGGGLAPKLSVVTHSVDSGNVSDLCSCRSKSSSSQRDLNVKVSHLVEVSLLLHQDDRWVEAEGVAVKADCRCKLDHYIRCQLNGSVN